MISMHNVEDIHLIGKGSAPDDMRWFELEVVTKDGIQYITLYMSIHTNAYKKIDALRAMIDVDRKVGGPVFT